MKNKTKCLIINLSTGFLWIIAYVFFCLRAVYCLNSSPFNAFLLSVIGLALNYVLSLFFHELGHLIFACASGARIERVNFGLFTASKIGQKFKVKFFTFGGANAGESVFSYEGELTVGKLSTWAFGGILFSLVYLLVVFLVLLLVKNPAVFLLFGAGGCSAGYLAAVNILPLDKTSDGARAFNTRKSAEYYSAWIAVHGFFRFASNTDEVGALKEAIVLPDNGQPFAIYLKYLVGVAENKIERATETLSPLFSKIGELTSDEFAIIFPEIVFAACVTRKVDFLNGNEILIENFFSESDSSASVLRAHCAYRMLKGQLEWARALEQGHKKAISEFNGILLDIEENASNQIKKVFGDF